MKTTIKLNAEDMRKIIAQAYNADPKNVNVTVESKWVGYGMAERKEAVPIYYIENRRKAHEKQAYLYLLPSPWGH